MGSAVPNDVPPTDPPAGGGDGDVRLRWLAPLVLLAVAGAALGWTAHRAWTDPAIEFLPPGTGTWWVAPQVPIRFTGDPVSPPVEFVATVPAGRDAGGATLRLRAFRQARLRVDGRPVPLPEVASWKRAVEVDLEPYLGVGRARLSVVVRNPMGPPALSVATESPRLAGLEWTTRVGAATGAGQPAVATGSRYGTGGPWPWAALLVVVTWGLLLAGAAGRQQGRSAARSVSVTRSHRLAKAAPWLLAALILAVLAADVRNARHYPPSRGHDAWGHLEYVERLRAGDGLPAADEGWQAYQPPLYYALAALFAGDGTPPTPGQLLNCLAHVALGLLAFAYCRWLFPDRPPVVALVAAATALALPAGLRMAPMVSNEPFAGSLTAAAFLATGLLARRAAGPRRGVTTDAAARGSGVLAAALGGLAHGAAMLAKYTGVLAFVATAVTWALTALLGPAARRRGHALRLVALGVVGLMVAGWFYLGHARDFGDPFVGNWDAASGHHYEQVPGYRDLASLVRFGPALDGERLHHAALRSVPEGFHVSLWADPHHFFLARDRDPGPETWLLWLGLVPTALGLAGFARSWRLAGAAGRPDQSTAHFSAVLLVLLVGVALLNFNLEIPFFSTAKAVFAWALFPLAAAWSAASLDLLWRRWRWLALPWVAATVAWMVLSWAVHLVGGPATPAGPAA